MWKLKSLVSLSTLFISSGMPYLFQKYTSSNYDDPQQGRVSTQPVHPSISNNQNPKNIASTPVSVPKQTAILRAQSNAAPVLSPSGSGQVPSEGQKCQPVEISHDMQEMLDLVNKDRANNGCRPLKYENCMIYLACKHDKDMEDNHFFSHTGSDQLKISGRAGQLQISFAALGENIGKGQKTIAVLQSDLMASAGHRNNILNREFEAFGFCSRTAKDGTTYYTQTFAKLTK